MTEHLLAVRAEAVRQLELAIDLRREQELIELIDAIDERLGRTSTLEQRLRVACERRSFFYV